MKQFIVGYNLPCGQTPKYFLDSMIGG